MNIIHNTPYPKLYIQKSPKKYVHKTEPTKKTTVSNQIDILNETLKSEKYILQQPSSITPIFKSNKIKPNICSKCKK